MPSVTDLDLLWTIRMIQPLRNFNILVLNISEQRQHKVCQLIQRFCRRHHTRHTGNYTENISIKSQLLKQSVDGNYNDKQNGTQYSAYHHQGR